MRPWVLATLLAALLAAIGPSAVAAQPPRAGFQTLYEEYQRFGAIAGCSHPEADLRTALDEIPADVGAYDPGFVTALNAALEQHAGGCGRIPPSPAETVSGSIVAADGSPGPAIAAARAAGAAAGEEPSTPAALIVLAACTCAALLLGGGLALTAPRSPRSRRGA
jgi:hypothetical protein